MDKKGFYMSLPQSFQAQKKSVKIGHLFIIKFDIGFAAKKTESALNIRILVMTIQLLHFSSVYPFLFCSNLHLPIFSLTLFIDITYM